MTRVTHIRILIAALFACCTMSVSAQDAYQQAVERYMNVSGNDFAKDKMTEALAKGCVKLGKSEAECKAFVDNEVWPQLMTGLTDAFRKDDVTIEDLNTVTAAMQTPEGQKALNDAKMAVSDIGTTMQKIQDTFGPSLKALMQGQEAQPVPAPEVCDSYRQKFHTYYTAYKVGGSVMQLANSLKGMLGDDPKAQEKFQKLMKFFSDNLENIMLTICKDGVTEADLDFYCNLLDTPSGKKVNDASNNAMLSVAPIMMESMKKFMDK